MPLSPSTAKGRRFYRCTKPRGCGGISIAADRMEDWIVIQLKWRLRSRSRGRRQVPVPDEEVARLLDQHSKAVKRLHADHYHLRSARRTENSCSRATPCWTLSKAA